MMDYRGLGKLTLARTCLSPTSPMKRWKWKALAEDVQTSHIDPVEFIRVGDVVKPWAPGGIEFFVIFALGRSVSGIFGLFHYPGSGASIRWK